MLKKKEHEKNRCMEEKEFHSVMKEGTVARGVLHQQKLQNSSNVL